MTHLHLQIQFASDFEGYATESCYPPPSPTHVTPPLSYFGSQRYMEHYADFSFSCFFFFFPWSKSDCDYVAGLGEMSVGILATAF